MPEETKVLRSECFPDLADETIFPRLSDAKLKWLAERGKRKRFEVGDVLYEHAVRDAPFFVIERGRIEFVDRKPGKDAVYVMIGADPCTEASEGMLAVDDAGYLLCGAGAADCPGYLCWPLSDREPHLLATIRPGVFAAGDVRAGASKRVAGAVGDGALVVRFAYDVLAG